MGEEVGGELVVVPHKAVAPVSGHAPERHSGVVGLQREAVEGVHQQVDARGLQRGLPGMRLQVVGVGEAIEVAHARGVAGLGQRGGPRQPSAAQVVVVVDGQTGLHDPAVAVFPAAVVTRVAVAERRERARRTAETVVQVQVSLQRKEALRVGAAAFLESLHVIVAHVAAHAPAGREVHIAAQSVEDRARELPVQPHVVGSCAENAVAAAVAVAHSEVEFRRRSGEGHEVDAGVGVDVDESELVGRGVAADIEHAHLPTAGVAQGYVDESYLRPVEQFGEVVGRQLHAPHEARADVGRRRHLHAAPHADGDVGQTGQL